MVLNRPWERPLCFDYWGNEIQASRCWYQGNFGKISFEIREFLVNSSGKKVATGFLQYDNHESANLFSRYLKFCGQFFYVVSIVYPFSTRFFCQFYSVVTIQTWPQLYIHSQHNSPANSVQWSPYEHGLVLACASSDGSISILMYISETNVSKNFCWIALPL